MEVPIRIDSRDDLRDYLRTLPPPKPGQIRVFRGQVHHHGTLIPSALRQPKSPDNRRFRAYCTLLASHLREEYGEDVSDLDSWLTWTVALAQHYSLGSPYLDVTQDLDTALWFATHQSETHAEVLVMGQPGPIDPVTDLPVRLALITFGHSAEPVGYFYVLDVPVWDGHGHPGHGELIDLSQAPEVFASSARMKAQQGCLIYAKGTTDDGDLSPSMMAPPIEVPTSISGNSSAMSVGDLFPSPANDHWYEALVSIPLSFGTPDNQHLVLRPTLPIALYFDTNDDRQLLRDTTCMLANPLLSAFLRSEQDRGADWIHAEAFPADAITILIDEPWYLVTPPLGDEWNESIAMLGLPTVAPVTNPEPGEPDQAPLDRVLVEFSVLEYSIWRGIETAGETRSVRRGLYIERQGSDIRLWDFTQEVPKGPITCMGPLPVQFDVVEKGFVMPGGRSPTEIMPRIFKNFLVVLTTLRELSKKPLVHPFPRINADNKNYVVDVQGGHQLIRTEIPVADFPIYLIGQGSTDSTVFGGVLSLKDAGRWSELNAEQLQQSLDDKATS